MKRLSQSFFAAAILLAGGCNFSAGVNKDLRSGLTYKFNGFRVKTVFICDAANKVMTDNKVSLNSQIAIVALGLNNYEPKDGKVFPGMMLSVTDKSGQPVLNEADLFAGSAGYPAASATELRGDITVAQPMRSGENYDVKIHVWDKVKPSNTLDAQVTISVQ